MHQTLERMPGRSYGNGHAMLLCVFAILCFKPCTSKNTLMGSSWAWAPQCSFCNIRDERPCRALGPIAAGKNCTGMSYIRLAYLERHAASTGLAMAIWPWMLFATSGSMHVASQDSCFNHIRSHMMQLTALSTAAMNGKHAVVCKMDAARTGRVQPLKCCLHCFSHV